MIVELEGPVEKVAVERAQLDEIFAKTNAFETRVAALVVQDALVANLFGITENDRLDQRLGDTLCDRLIDAWLRAFRKSDGAKS